MVSWFVRTTPERAVCFRVLAGDIVFGSWARHLTLTVPLSTQVYKWVRRIDIRVREFILVRMSNRCRVFVWKLVLDWRPFLVNPLILEPYKTLLQGTGFRTYLLLR